MSIADKKQKSEVVHYLIESAWQLGRIRMSSTAHANHRAEQRAIDVLDLREVILYGVREENQDSWKEDWGHWVYAIRNRNVDGRDIRVIFDVEGYPDVVVVTLMHVYA